MRNKRDIAREAILSAGSLLEEAFRRGVEGSVTEKDRNDFVTEVDTQSERLIGEKLSRAYPDIGIMAEEEGAVPDQSQYWIIDPLDGTTNFIHGYPQIGVSIALSEDGETRLGLVHDPLRGELFEAVKGEGAFCNGSQISISAAGTLEESLLGTGFPFRVYQHLDSYLEVFKELFLRCRGVRRAGAAVLDLCHVAAGRLDGFWELYLKPWDMAAGALIVTEAGGVVSDFFGGPDYLGSGHIIASTPAIYEEIHAATARHFTREMIRDL
jgi:myo-inositol-1(or 4)-monophosphatase